MPVPPGVCVRTVRRAIPYQHMTDLPGRRPPASTILFYQTEDGRSRIEVRLDENTVWLSQALLAELFQTSVPNISMHIRNILEEGELRRDSVVKNCLTTAADGKEYEVAFYNLDLILSIGYRVRSHRGTQFRRWATERLREYLVKGFALDDQRLKDGAPLARTISTNCWSAFATSAHLSAASTRRSRISMLSPLIAQSGC